MDIEKLKQKILDLAIRGKLVPQDPNDEPSSVLIEKIKNEKNELIKQGKIKPTKDDSYIYNPIIVIMRRKEKTLTIYRKKSPLIYLIAGFGLDFQF